MNMSPMMIAVLGAAAVALLAYAALNAYLNSARGGMSDFESHPADGASLLLKDILAPLASIVSGMHDSPSASKELSEYRRLLISAGGFAGLNAAEIYSLKIVMPLAFAIFAVPACVLLKLDMGIASLCVVFFAVLLYFYPATALRQKAERRRSLFVRQLPGGLDILKIAADAGLDFQKSISYLVDIYVPGPVREEFSVFQREIKLGVPATDALVNVAHRIGAPEAATVFISLSQAVEMGTSVSEMLGDTVAEIRKKRLLSAETEAQKTVVKITFPLLFLILPGIFIVLLAPMIKPIMQAFAGF